MESCAICGKTIDKTPHTTCARCGLTFCADHMKVPQCPKCGNPAIPK